MNDETPFDAYHRWLGISKREQPADHYRLLGIEQFESDSEVIRDAAQQRIAHVKTYQLGPYQALSQKILNELGAAKACLLDPEQKKRYDVGLLEAKNATARRNRTRLWLQSLHRQAQRQSPVIPPPAIAAASVPGAQTERTRRPKVLLLVGVGVVLGALISLLVAFTRLYSDNYFSRLTTIRIPG